LDALYIGCHSVLKTLVFWGEKVPKHTFLQRIL
jgi:hypothetical protein